MPSSLTTDVAGKMGVSVGDTIFVKIDGDEKVEWTVVGTVTDLSNMQRNIYVPLGTLSTRSGPERARHHRLVIDHARYGRDATARGKESARST